MIEREASDGYAQTRTIKPRGDREATGAAVPADSTSHQAMERVWARRARELAQTVEQEDYGEHIALLSFKLGHELYAVEACYVSDIRPAQRITPVPRVPTWVAGVVNSRGRIVSVLHLQRFLGLPDAGHTANPFLVAAETPDMEIALLVDDVLSVETRPAARVQDPEGAIRGIPPEYVLGVSTQSQGVEQSMLVILNLAAILGDKQLIVREELE